MKRYRLVITLTLALGLIALLALFAASSQAAPLVRPQWESAVQGSIPTSNTHAALLAVASGQLMASGGPDTFGYTYIDSTEPGGPSFAWEEISGTGTLLTGWTSFDNGYAGPVPIGFNFNYYDNAYSHLYVNTNGYVTFGQGYGDIPWGSLPQMGTPNNDIALFGADLYLYNYGADSAVYYQTLANPNRLVIEFVNLHYCCGQNMSHTFEVILYPSGDILAQYRFLNGTTTTYVGIENNTGSDGLGYGAILGDNRAIHYHYPTGVFLSPPSRSGFGKIGATVMYEVGLANQTSAPDSFSLTIQSGHSWTTTLSLTQTGTLADSDGVTFTVGVYIPPTALPGSVDSVTIRATSIASPTVFSDTLILSTTATTGELAYVMVANHNYVALVDAAAHNVVGTINLAPAGCSWPWQAAIPPHGGTVWVSCRNSNNLIVLDRSSNTILGAVNDVISPESLAFTNDGMYALVGSRSNNQVTVVNTTNYSKTYIYTPGPPAGVAVHPYLPQAYVTNRNSGVISVIDTAALSVTRNITISSTSISALVSRDGLRLYTTNQGDDSVSVINILTGQEIAHISLGSQPNGLAISPDGGQLFVTGSWSGPYGSGGAVKVVNTASLAVERTIAIDLAGNFDFAWDAQLTCDGRELVVTNPRDENNPVGRQVAVIDTTAYTLTALLATPDRNQDGYPDWGARGMALCPQYVAAGIYLYPTAQANQGARGQVVRHVETLFNATDATDIFSVTVGGPAWDTSLSAGSVGPIASKNSLTFTVFVTVPVDAAWYLTDTVLVTATSAASPTIYSDTATLITEAYAPPSLTATPQVLTSTQVVNEMVTKPITISNGNGVTLTFDIKTGNAESNALEAILASLNSHYGAVLSAIPNRYDFSEGEIGTSISDGGGDMYDEGNFLSTNLGGNIPYSNNTIATSPYAGGSGKYFTRKYPGLFVFAADLQGVDAFQISGNLGADGSGNANGAVLETELYGVNYYGFVKRVYNAGDPSVNHLIIVADNSSVTHTFSINTNDDSHQVYNLSQNTRLYYLLYAGTSGYYINDDATLNIMRAFLGTLGLSPSASWLSADPVSGTVAALSSSPVQVVFNANNVQPGIYPARVWVQSNALVTPSVSIPVTMTVNPTADMGWVEGVTSDAWTSLPLTSTVELLGVYSMTARPNYKIWAPAGTYSMTVHAPGYVTQTVPVNIVAQQGVTQNLALVPNVARMHVTPASLEVTHAVGDVATRALTITNSGPAPLNFEIGGISVTDDFSRDTNLWQYYGSAYRDDSQDYVVLTDSSAWQAGVLWLKESVKTPFVVEFRYRVGDYMGADGFTMMFYKDSNYVPYSGWCLAFGENPDYCQASGYGIEFDGWANGFDPFDDHIALIKDSTYNHLASVYDSRVADYQWHQVRVEVGTDLVTVAVDGNQVLSRTVMLDKSFTKLGFSAATGGYTGWHIIDDVHLRTIAVLPGWLSAYPLTGTVPAYSSAPIQITFNATGMQPGIQIAPIVVQSNDSVTPSVIIPVTMTVNPTANMGRVTGAVLDAWTSQPLTATVELAGVYSTTANSNYTIWASAGAYSLTAYTAGYYTVTRPAAISAGGLTAVDLALEPAQPRLEWMPVTISVTAAAGGKVYRTWPISNTGPLPLSFAVHEISSTTVLRSVSGLSNDLTGKRILYDRAHGGPALSDYSTLAGDVISAGAVITENWYSPIDANVLRDYDVLWSNCCGGSSWGFGELTAVQDWLNQGGAVFVQGESSNSTVGLASIFGIDYQSGGCTSGPTTSIGDHPIREGVTTVNVDWTCWRLAPASGAKIVVFDPQGQPHVVAQEQSGGKMVVVSSEDFANWSIYNNDNRRLANNIIQWLAQPGYGDVPWLSASPLTGTVQGHGYLPLTLGFDTTLLAAGTYHAALAVEHNDPARSSPVEIPVTLTVAARQAALSLAPVVQGGSGLPGQTVVYTFTLINHGNYTDTFNVTASGVWAATLPITSAGPIGDGQGFQFTVNVAIPAVITGVVSDTTTVVARSAFDPGVSKSVQVITIGNPYRIVLPIVLRP